MRRRPGRSTLFPYTTLFRSEGRNASLRATLRGGRASAGAQSRSRRSEEHTSELQSQFHLVCRLLLEKKKLIENVDFNVGHIASAKPSDLQDSYVYPWMLYSL